ncbi:hypothetical protein V7195_16165 [Priestia megaterium]|uniref:hypothetical protein n=1 Tax=Priestia megaterium TaxID=1404 RepID=UPI000BF68145|nr:hypothetical protein [Priestia megaterium]PFK02135.1 hypothetical protein COI96_07020 [Priestia megaterium]PMD07998.1 hypothetical protein CJ194_18515 [Priestia megaterium]
MTMNTKEHPHTLKLSQVEGGSDEGTVAQLVVTNAVNGNFHKFHVRSGDTEEIDVVSSDIFHKSPSKVKYFYGGCIQELLHSAFKYTQLYQIVSLSNKTIQVIEEAYETGAEFSYTYGPSEMAKYFSLHYFIVNEELAELMIKIEEETLTIDAIIDFGKLVEVDAETYEGDAGYFYSFFEEVVKKAQQNGSLNEEDSRYVNIAFNYLNFNNEDDCFPF